MKGVCDTPLHLFGYFMDNIMVKRDDFTLYHPTKQRCRTCTIPAMKGVCDTPLHMFGYFMGNMMVEQHATTPM